MKTRAAVLRGLFPPFLVLLILGCLAKLSVQQSRPLSGWFNDTRPDKVILIDGRFFGDPPGGVEALIQLSIAMAAAAVDRKEVFVDLPLGTYHPRFIKLYGDQLIKQTKSYKELKAGDIFITSEGIECPRQVPPGVHVFIWMLANYMGCRDKGIRYISHNSFLANFTYLDRHIKLPRERIIHPYVSQPIVNLAHRVAGLEVDGSILYERSEIKTKKTNLVLLDSDVPEPVRNAIRKVAAELGGSTRHLESIETEELMKVYMQGKIVIDWCMRGSERCPLEASLFGAIPLSNNCDTGTEFTDFPVPRNYLLLTNSRDESELLALLRPLIADIFSNYWFHAHQFELFRKMVIDHNPTMMIKDCVRFLSSVHIDENTQEGRDSLMEGGCIAC